jgi:hypothetical protein
MKGAAWLIEIIDAIVVAVHRENFRPRRVVRRIVAGTWHIAECVSGPPTNSLATRPRLVSSLNCVRWKALAWLL